LRVFVSSTLGELAAERQAVSRAISALRVGQRILALTAAVWHNRTTGQPVTRSLIAYDH
jgi:hypothetical protein